MNEIATKNRLADSYSPYLLQHADNPVNWYPWGDEAFAAAAREDKPVFLSIGYSTCHWCHVMEHESFSDKEVAALMNDAFISIKVDREERPDIDGIYMAVCQMLTGSGGWPLTVIMTPDKRPFFAGTYFPKKERFGRIGMLDLIPRIKGLWQEKRDEVLKSAAEIVSVLNTASSLMHKQAVESNFSEIRIFDKAFNELSSEFDEEYGGFGTSMKFPMPHNLFFLLRYWRRNRNEKAFKMVEKTLKEMRKGGIYDHIGFGICRYSTDRRWLVPHFEKMLYDQALAAVAYTEMYLASGDEFYKQTAEEILHYVTNRMTSPEGGFYSAEDADSEGEEGKFYLWSKKEIEEVLNEHEAEIINKVFNVTEEGNWIEQAHGLRNGTNILHISSGSGNFETFPEQFKISKEDFYAVLESSRKKLFIVREKRVHPFKDDKILTDWNSLMISAFAKAAQAFGNADYTAAAKKAADFIIDNLKDRSGRLLHRYRNGTAGIPASLDDYAFFISSLIDLYETCFEIKYLREALNLNDMMLEHFRDRENGGFYFTSDDSEELLLRQKEINDGAVPSGNSAAMLNLLRLSRITGNTFFGEISADIKNSFSYLIYRAPSAFTYFLSALDFAAGPSAEIILSGDISSAEASEMEKIIRSKFIPNKVIIYNSPDRREELIQIVPFIKDYREINGQAAVYLCENYICRLPVTKSTDLEEIIKTIC